MKVLHVVRQYAPSIGGMEAHVRDLTENLCAAGISCDVLTLDRIFSTRSQPLPGHEVIGCCNVHRIPYYGSRRYPIALSALSRLRGYDLVHVHGVDFFADFLSLTRALHGKPLVISTHGGFFHTDFAGRFKKLFFRTVTKGTLGNYRRVICVSEQDLRLFSQITDNGILINNGIETGKYRAIDRQVEPYLLLSVGRLSQNKRHDRMIKVFAEVRKTVPAARLAIVGSDWDAVLPGLQALVAELGLTGAVTFHGEIPQADLERLMARAHFFLSSSEYEGFGLTVAECMAAGIIPVLQNIKAFENLTENGKFGYLTDFDDSAKAAREICSVMSLDGDDYSRESELVRHAVDRFSWRVLVKEFIDIYQQAIKS